MLAANGYRCFQSGKYWEGHWSNAGFTEGMSIAQPSGGKTTITTRNRYIDHSLDGFEKIPEGEYAVLKIQDRGLGISEPDLSRLTEPFFTTRTEAGGTGLGLAIVRSAVAGHGGTAWVADPPPGGGTRLVVELPTTA